MSAWLDEAIQQFCSLFPDLSFWSWHHQVRGFLAILLVALVCGAVGSLVVSKRMAFFSDALAHCSFAGVALGLIIGLVFGIVAEEYRNWILLIMVVFGILM